MSFFLRCIRSPQKYIEQFKRTRQLDERQSQVVQKGYRYFAKKKDLNVILISPFFGLPVTGFPLDELGCLIRLIRVKHRM